MKHLKNIAIVLITTLVLYACSPAGGDRTGHEYMPDMAHSIAYESNVYDYYYYNTWDSASTVKLKDMANPRLPVAGTMPRGFVGVHYADGTAYAAVVNMLRGGNSPNAIAVPLNGHVPYYYADTEEERVRASNEINNNPFPITEAGLAKGKELYNVHCGICHGEKGNGAGYLYDTDTNPNAKYPAAPANFLQDTFYVSSNGRFYHAIMYGKNVMGGYADKLSYEERWQVIHYIRSLQAAEKKLKYTAEANTLNPDFGMPEKAFKQLLANRVSGQFVAPTATPQDSTVRGGGAEQHSDGMQQQGHGGGSSIKRKN